MSDVPSSLADFYRRRLRRYRIVRVPKLAVWWTIWFIRWRLLWPAYHWIKGTAWFFRWRIVWPLRRELSRAYTAFYWRVLHPIRTGIGPMLRWRVVWPIKIAFLALRWFVRWKVVHVVVKYLVLKPVWFLRSRVLRPLALNLFPPSVLRAYHRISGAGIAGLWPRSDVPSLPLLAQSEALGRMDEPRTIEVFPACVVECARPELVPRKLARHVPALQARYEFPAVRVSQMQDVEVIGRSNLLGLEDAVVHHDLYRFSHDYTSEELHGRIKIYPGRKVVRRKQASPVHLEFESAAAFTDACAPNYAHWLTEVLPRIHAYAVSAKAGGTVILDSGLHRNLMASAELMLGPGVELVELPVGASARVKTLKVVSPVGYIPFDRRPGTWDGHDHGRFSAPALLSMRAHLDRMLGPSATVSPARIMLRRSSVGRAMKNEQQLEDALVPRGFVPVYPERLSFEEQYRLFSRAEVVLGATGAAFANLLFCPPETRVIICLSAHPNHSFGYWQGMAAAVGNKVTYVLGKITGARSAGIHADFAVELDAVLRAIEDEVPVSAF